ncbi:MAG: class I SAM-dependent methyltransferase [Pseudomonadota bacterium]
MDKACNIWFGGEKMTPTVLFRSLEVPLYPRVINHGLYPFVTTADLIDKLDAKDREWAKVDVLVNDCFYLQFLSNLCKREIGLIVEFLNEFKRDDDFKKSFSLKLGELDSSGIKHADDLRFHSLTIYCLVRALKPNLMIETGVAQGKSSSMALLAMHHNRCGKLVSIDLPNPEGKVLADGAQTSTGIKDVGWLVPDYLRARWDLRLGDARELLPKVLSENPQVPDIFFHDSLHTYEHTKFELQTVLSKMSSGLIICDNIEMGSGKAFHEVLEERKKVAHAYRDFAGFLV